MPRRLKGMPYRGESASRASLAQRLEQARRVATTAQGEVRRLEKLWNSQRPWRHCERCGHDWQGVNPDKMPRCCARCHSAGWQAASTSQRARKPTDAANPKWGRYDKDRIRPGKVEAIKVTWPEPTPQPVLVEVAAKVEADTLAELRKVFTPAELASASVGLPPPPALDSIRLPAPPTLAAPEPILYQPRLPQPEPQPETISSRVPAPVDPEPSWEDLLPKLPTETIILADMAESAWEEYVEAN